MSSDLNHKLLLELDRRYRIAAAHADDPESDYFEMCLRIRDFVALVESQSVLTAAVQEDRERWNKKVGEYDPAPANAWGRFRRGVQLDRQADFYFSRAYRRLEHVYHALNDINGIEPPADFDWSKNRKKAYGDMVDIQTGGDDLLMRWFNSLYFRRWQYKVWLERTYTSLSAAVSASTFNQSGGGAIKAEQAASVPVTNEAPPTVQLSERTGDFTYLNVSGNFAPKSQEFIMVKLLLQSDDNLATYEALIGALFPTVDVKSKSIRQDLAKVLNRIKAKMQMPIVNADIFTNVKNVGYRIEYPPSNPKE